MSEFALAISTPAYANACTVTGDLHATVFTKRDVESKEVPQQCARLGSEAFDVCKERWIDGRMK